MKVLGSLLAIGPSPQIAARALRLVGGIALAVVCVGSLAIAGFVVTENNRDHESG